jgi:hypothetical protein
LNNLLCHVKEFQGTRGVVIYRQHGRRNQEKNKTPTVWNLEWGITFKSDDDCHHSDDACINNVLGLLQKKRRSVLWETIKEHLFFTIVVLKDLHVFRSWAFLTLRNIETDALAFIQCFEATGLNSTEMNKHIATFILFDEPKAFAFIEPFYFTF